MKKIITSSFLFLTITACGGGGSAPSSPAPNPPPSIDLTASKLLAESEETITISWTSSDSNSCNTQNDWSESTLTSANVDVTFNGIGNKTFTLTCYGDGGETSESVTVNYVLSQTQLSSQATAAAAVATIL